jgi:hypothetical protein
MVYERMEHSQRAEFITEFAKAFAVIVHDNRAEISNKTDHKADFIKKLNLRAAEYAVCDYSDEEGASFTLRRIFGNYVMDVMGEKQRKWIPDYVMDIEAPQAIATLRRALPTLLM